MQLFLDFPLQNMEAKGPVQLLGLFLDFPLQNKGNRSIITLYFL